MQSMYYIGLDVHKKTISYCVKDDSGHIHGEGTIPATRLDLALRASKTGVLCCRFREQEGNPGSPI